VENMVFVSSSNLNLVYEGEDAIVEGVGYSVPYGRLFMLARDVTMDAILSSIFGIEGRYFEKIEKIIDLDCIENEMKGNNMNGNTQKYCKEHSDSMKPKFY
jgi:hypothetical protein